MKLDPQLSTENVFKQLARNIDIKYNKSNAKHDYDNVNNVVSAPSGKYEYQIYTKYKIYTNYTKICKLLLLQIKKINQSIKRDS